MGSTRIPWFAVAIIVVVGLARATSRAQSARAAGLEPWASNTHPADVAKRHVEEISTGHREYRITQGGTMDGRNCRSPMGTYEAFRQTWESNRSVRMENVGETDAISPWLSNGRNNFRTLEEIVAAAVDPGMSDKERALALYHQEIRHRYHFHVGNANNGELCDPVKVFNVYGHNTCGNDSICLAGLWHRAGLKASPARVVGHCVSQAFFDGRWNLMDGDMQGLYLLRDNGTVAGEQDVVRDHDLIKRAHTQGILRPDGRPGDEWEASLYVYEGDAKGDRNCGEGHTMDMVLRPGEALTWRWGHLAPAKCIAQSPMKFPDTVCNGLWEYRPDFAKQPWRKGAESVGAIAATADGLAAEPGKTGTVVWKIRSPYPFVAGRIEAEPRGAKFTVSWDGKSWQDAGESLDALFPPSEPARYEYFLRCELAGEARLRRLAILNDLQMAPLALPEMAVGENLFLYTDRSPGDRKVRITHEWVERSASRPPAPPAAAEYPGDGAEAAGTGVVFRWAPAVDPDGDRVVDYYFELSDRADMRWPLSTNFAKLISNTPDRGKAQYSLPCAGLLTPDRKCYWRVRAQDDKGVWGAWSKTWSFTPRGPTPPMDVTLDFDSTRGIGTLRWKPNPVGLRPVKYRIYGSDEKGFSVSDEPYQANTGISKELRSPFPANFVSETTATELPVVGADVGVPNANRAFYRVVAVDDRGNRSGPSDYAAAPRPFIFTTPPAVAKVGAEYRYRAGAIRSLGDLRMRVINGKETPSFWDIEKPGFALQKGPSWLRVHEASGMLSGTPDTAGQVEVTLTATIEGQVRTLDERALSWGVEKVTGVTTERLGQAVQRFVITVSQ